MSLSFEYHPNTPGCYQNTSEGKESSTVDGSAINKPPWRALVVSHGDLQYRNFCFLQGSRLNPPCVLQLSRSCRLWAHLATPATRTMARIANVRPLVLSPWNPPGWEPPIPLPPCSMPPRQRLLPELTVVPPGRRRLYSLPNPRRWRWRGIRLLSSNRSLPISTAMPTSYTMRATF